MGLPPFISTRPMPLPRRIGEETQDHDALHLKAGLHDLTPMRHHLTEAGGHVVHAEIFFDPQTHTARGIDIGVVIGGLASASARAERELGITSGLILCFLRHLSEDEALATLQSALPYRAHLLGEPPEIGGEDRWRDQKFTHVDFPRSADP